MVLDDRAPPSINPKAVKGTIWEQFVNLGPTGLRPFSIDSPTKDESPQLAAGQVRRILFRGSGEVLLYNIDLPTGVTLDLILDGVSKRYSHGNEAGVLRWERGQSTLRFTSLLELVVSNTAGVGQGYRIHVSGA
jgi:hypothetical protein